jgi:DNA-binding MarR family transcriptional regulator/molybdenum-dependent DNA-binding transcriptional regulator ModE
LKLDQLRDVVTIAECGTMRAAARHLHAAQPVLARNLRNLEREVGGKLFERRARGMTPTPLGDIVIEGGRRVLDEIRRISDSVAQIKGKRTPHRKTPRPTVKAEPDENRTGHVFTDLVLETFRLNGRLLAYGDRLVKPINLTSSRWQVLGSLPHNHATVSEIARYMGLQRQSVQRTIDVLCKEGLVELVDNPNHRRARLAVLTAKGWDTVAEANKARDRWRKRMTASLTKAELETAYQVLRRIRRELGDRSASDGSVSV